MNIQQLEEDPLLLNDPKVRCTRIISYETASRNDQAAQLTQI